MSGGSSAAKRVAIRLPPFAMGSAWTMNSSRLRSRQPATGWPPMTSLSGYKARNTRAPSERVPQPPTSASPLQSILRRGPSESGDAALRGADRFAK